MWLLYIALGVYMLSVVYVLNDLFHIVKTHFKHSKLTKRHVTEYMVFLLMALTPVVNMLLALFFYAIDNKHTIYKKSNSSK